MVVEFVYALIFLALLVGTYTDIKTREVPDWLNYAMIAAGLGIHGVQSLIQQDWHPIFFSLLGLGMMYGLALLMFQTGQWGGGDSKMLMGLGALIGIEWTFRSMFLGFLVNIMIFGSIYGLAWTMYLMFRNWKKFYKQYITMQHQISFKKARKIFSVFAVVFFLFSFFIRDQTIKLFLMLFSVMVIITYYLWLSIKAVELSCMEKYVEPERLTEGDWIVKEVKVGGKYICGPKDLGISMGQIHRLIKLKQQGKIKKILIKEGIPFVPSFLMAFAASVFFGDIFIWLGI